MRFSSSFKVGILTIAAILILLFTVMWVKGRTISAGARIAVNFKDINGLRAGSGVQMMGVRIGQVEELNPKINKEDSYVEVKFVITEPNIKIPSASSISIQQSGIIGEQFLEITPPAVRTVYIPYKGKSNIIHAGDKVQMVLSKELHDIGEVKKTEVVETKSINAFDATDIKTDNALKIGYIVDMPGLIMPDLLKGEIVTLNNENKLKLNPVKLKNIPLPHTDSPYTVIEPMRISDFMKLQYRSASALAETNEKLSAILSDDVMNDIKITIKNAESLTANANGAIDKANALIDASKDDMQELTAQINELSGKLNTIADNIISVTNDKDFAKNFNKTVDNVNKLAGNVNKILEDKQTEELLTNINTTAKNVSEISGYVNDLTKDEKLKAALYQSVSKLNTALDKLTITLDTVNYVTEDERDNIKQSLKEVEATTKNVKKFSEKLNKRFLLFRLMF